MAGKQITNIEVKKTNRNRTFRYICKCDKVSNPDIAHELNISLPTVMQNTKELMERGLIEEAGELESTGGRRAKAVSVIADAKLAVGLDITQNHVGVVLTNLKGEVLKYERLPLYYSGDQVYYGLVNQILDEFLEEIGKNVEHIIGIGISFPGIVDQGKKEIARSHALHVDHLPFAEISKYFRWPCFFLNDANAGAYAEGILQDEPERFFYFSLSNTVGGAIFDTRQPVDGENHRCGEVGHMTVIEGGEACYCGKKGCLDAYCSAKRLSDMREGKLAKFFADLEAGEPDVRAEWDRYVQHLAVAINNVRMLLDCNVVLGGYVGSYVAPFIEEIRRKAAERDTFGGDCSSVRACRYRVGEAALGAALRVIETFIEQV